MQVAQRARGRFMTVEGVDGAGKSTQLQWIAGWLRQQGIDFVQTREPGGTPLGEQLRALVLSQPMDIETEALLMFAGRREHIVQVIEPALARGQWVLCDRFTDASYAYQGGGRGLSAARLATLEHWVQGLPGQMLQPDLTLLFDVPLGVSQARMAASREQLDRFEREAEAFHARVRDAYLARAAADPQRIQIIDAARDIAAVQAELGTRLGAWLSAIQQGQA
ncbi:dTMP kinase [Silvimonas sp. JCM 19000]